MSLLLLLHHGPDALLTWPPLWIFIPAAVSVAVNILRSARARLGR